MVLQRSRLLRGLVAIGLVTLAAVGLRLSEGGADADFAVARGVLGETVAVNDGTVTAGDVRVGTVLSRNDEVYATTPGLFVVVRVRLAATGPARLRGYQATALGDGTAYEEFGANRTGLLEPGFAEERDLVFEVDPARLADLTLDLDPAELIVAYPQHARIHLGITAANADDWRTAGRDQVLTPRDATRRGI